MWIPVAKFIEYIHNIKRFDDLKRAPKTENFHNHTHTHRPTGFSEWKTAREKYFYCIYHAMHSGSARSNKATTRPLSYFMHMFHVCCANRRNILKCQQLALMCRLKNPQRKSLRMTFVVDDGHFQTMRFLLTWGNIQHFIFA